MLDGQSVFLEQTEEAEMSKEQTARLHYARKRSMAYAGWPSGW
jgi:hypothetical protein